MNTYSASNDSPTSAVAREGSATEEDMSRSRSPRTAGLRPVLPPAAAGGSTASEGSGGTEVNLRSLRKNLHADVRESLSHVAIERAELSVALEPFRSHQVPAQVTVQEREMAAQVHALVPETDRSREYEPTADLTSSHARGQEAHRRNQFATTRVITMGPQQH